MQVAIVLFWDQKEPDDNEETDEESVDEEPEENQGIVVFNVLTPSENGQNDFFRIDGIERFPENTLRIFNKSGILEHETMNYGIAGNLFYGVGNQHNELLSGTYIYVLEYVSKSGKERKTGYLVIL